MSGVDFCNNIVTGHYFSSPISRNDNFITRFLTPQDIVIKDNEGNSPLHFAAMSDDVNLIKILLSAGAIVNNTRMDGFTPLHMAIESGKEENIKILLDYGARVDRKDLFGKTLLHLLANVHYEDEKKLLRVAKTIFDKTIDIKSLLNECTDSGETALHYAIINGSEELVELFLQYGANVNAKNRDGKSPLYYAVEFDRVNIAKMLLNYKARVNEKMNHGLTPLHEAIKKRSEKCVELLINFGANVNIKDMYGKTPLHMAARLNYLDERIMDKIVKLLLENGADVNDYTNSGETAFHCAIVNGNEKLVRLFLEYGGNVNIKNYDGKSPLHFAIQYSNKSIVKLLLDRGAEIDDKTNDGKLSLHVAVAVEDEHIMKILLEHNANVNAVDRSGKTPLTLAFEVAYMRSIYNPWNGFCPINSEIGCDDNMFELLIKHIAKSTCICDENLKLINNDKLLNQFYTNCQMELAKMKENKICDNIDMYKILTKNINTIVGYSRNEKLLKIFESNIYADKFPIYYNMLKERFYKAENRKKLLESCSETFSLLVKPHFKFLPDIIINEILSYLTIQDLVNLKMS